ncbi:LCP family protein [Clostridium sp.]|uniref:LCP family protein n=2 Tax=Clostridium sp. TaxID=1506 RepID=UPI002FCA00EE
MRHEEDKNRRVKNKEKKKMSTKKKILISIGIVLLLIILSAGAFYLYVRGQIYQENSGTSPEVTYEEQAGITNILLIGTDARKLDEAARADAIIIATIDNNHKKLKLTSIMRDTLVDVEGHGEQKINAALAFGGPELLMKTIKDNFGISLNKYAMVNFGGFQQIIDEVGGIEVDVHDYEIPELNKFIGEYEKDKSPKITEPGMQKLDGQQALAYARIRKVGNGDYERTERQRRVIDLVTQKFKDLSPLKYPSVMASLLPYVKTNIEPFMILNYAYTASKFPSLDFEQLRVPFDDEISWGGLYKNLGWVLIVDKEQNAKIMEDFIFNDKTPDANSYSVKVWKDKLSGYLNQNNQHIEENGPLKEDEDYDYVPPVKNNTNNNTNNNKKPSTGTQNKPSTGTGSKPSTGTGNNGGGNDSGNSSKPGTGENLKPDEKPEEKPDKPVEPDKPVVPPADGSQSNNQTTDKQNNKQ